MSFQPVLYLYTLHSFDERSLSGNIHKEFYMLFWHSCALDHIHSIKFLIRNSATNVDTQCDSLNWQKKRITSFCCHRVNTDSTIMHSVDQNHYYAMSFGILTLFVRKSSQLQSENWTDSISQFTLPRLLLSIHLYTTVMCNECHSTM